MSITIRALFAAGQTAPYATVHKPGDEDNAIQSDDATTSSVFDPSSINSNQKWPVTASSNKTVGSDESWEFAFIDTDDSTELDDTVYWFVQFWDEGDNPAGSRHVQPQLTTVSSVTLAADQSAVTALGGVDVSGSSVDSNVVSMIEDVLSDSALSADAVEKIGDIFNLLTSSYGQAGSVGEKIGDIATAAAINTAIEGGQVGIDADAAKTASEAVKAVTDALPDSGALSSLAQGSALATTDGKVDSILTDTGTTIPGVLGTPAGADMSADIAAAKAVIDSLSTNANPALLQSTTIATLTSQTVGTLTAGSADDDAYNGSQVIFTDQSTATQVWKGVISDYVGSTKQYTLREAPGFTIATGDSMDILATQDGKILDLISQSQNNITFSPDPSRTWVPRRNQTSKTIPKRTDEVAVFYVDCSKMMGNGEFLAAVDTFSVNVNDSGCTVVSGWPTKESGSIIGIKLSGGTPSADPYTLDIEFATDQDSEPIEASVKLLVTASE